jgi:hypothetical protein
MSQMSQYYVTPTFSEDERSKSKIWMAGQWHIFERIHKKSEHLTTMMFVAARRLAGSSNAVSRSATAAQNVSCRFMSVVNLSDDEAVKKFRAINTKSVLYFTASCKYSTSKDNLVLCSVTL